MMRLHYSGILIVVLALTACASSPDTKVLTPVDYSQTKPNTDDIGLGFPYEDPRRAVFIHCFGLCPWNDSSTSTGGEEECHQEKHVGFDIYPVPLQQSMPLLPTKQQTALVRIIAPADAIVERITTGETGAITQSTIVALKLNQYWYAAYSFEPHSKKTAILKLQRNSIVVNENQSVRKGELIGSLVVTNDTKVIPSLHFSFFYLNPDQSLDELMTLLNEDIENVNVSDHSDLKAAGWPWDNQDRGIPTTFFCPYEFSSKNAKNLYDQLPNLDTHGVRCSSMCAYGSTQGNCGSAQIE